MPTLRSLVSLFCAAGLLSSVAACSSDDHPGDAPDESSDMSPATGVTDAKVGDGGHKDGGVGKDAKVAQGDGASRDASQGEGCGSVRAAAELERGPVDIVLALDTSGSMAG
ncbi:MAG: hypothetical protein JWN48_3317, partial [Myxococcaceae bacterium]|nr:hypothetical protein [Myxococcaceae bacterium]